ncbi:MAG: hypothetical protein HY074_12990 [Deltaproteobacteria bacterium]|nr:hypothetical protein [Deltaproteobacteria bacterium]
MRAIPFTILLALVATTFSAFAGGPERDMQWSPANNVNWAVQMTHIVSITSYVNGELSTKRTTRDEIARCCPGCVNLDGQRYYDSIATTDRTIVNACAARSSVGTSVYVRHTYEYLCRKHGFFRANENEVVPANYRLTHQADGIHLGLAVGVHYPKDVSQKRADFMLERTRACLPQIKKLWAGYGITFDVKFENDAGRTGKPDAETMISDIEGRSYSDNFNFLGVNYSACMNRPEDKGLSHEERTAKCEGSRQTAYCTKVLHELGHLVGFGDEYEDKDLCPDRDMVTKHVFPFSPMGYDYAGFDFLDYYPEHIRQVVGPICR